MAKNPRPTGKMLIKLLVADGWVIRDEIGTHGVVLKKKFGDKTHVTVVPNKRAIIPPQTLSFILGSLQTKLGMAGLRLLYKKYRN